jgi:FtsZ-binding cell division protein ZapB
MNRDQHKNKLYGITKQVRNAIKAQAIQGYESVLCSAHLSRRGKKLNGIDKAAPENFSKLMRDFVASEEPDKMRVELRGDKEEILWSKTYQLDIEPEIQMPANEEFRGLGQAEVTELVNQKLQEIRRSDELEELRSYRDDLENENNQLKSQLQELEGIVDAKKNIEYYSNIIGLALPGLAKMLNKTGLGGTLGMLAGIEDQQVATGDAPKEKGQRETIIDLVTEFMQGLDDAHLGHLYLVFVELSNNPALIGTLLSHLSQKQDTI